MTPDTPPHWRALANASGALVVMAADHRDNLQAALSRAMGRIVAAPEIGEFKSLVVRTLSPLCSAVLLDPEYGLPAAALRAPGCGLLLAYEKSGYDNSRPGRRPDLLPACSVARLRAAGAQGVKILLHYSPDEAAVINQEKQAFIERVGAECRAQGLPFFLEIVTYDAGGAASPVVWARHRPEAMRAVIAEFSQPGYCVSVFKLEVPIDAQFLAGARAFAGEAAYDRSQALRAIRGAVCGHAVPIVFLSGGAPNAAFVESLQLVTEAGVGFAGVVCGRAIWNGGIAAYARGGAPALANWLEETGRANLAAVRACAEARQPVGNSR